MKMMKNKLKRMKCQGGIRDLRLGPPFARRAQGGEMIGLIVIVILLVVIFGVYLNFSLKPKSSGQEGQADIANTNLVRSMANSNVCPGKSLEDAIKAWANNEKVCGQDNMEQFITEQVDIMLKAYLRKDKYDKKEYQLTIKPAEGSTKQQLSFGTANLNCGNMATVPSEKIGMGRLATMQFKTCVSL